MEKRAFACVVGSTKNSFEMDYSGMEFEKNYVIRSRRKKFFNDIYNLSQPNKKSRKTSKNICPKLLLDVPQDCFGLILQFTTSYVGKYWADLQTVCKQVKMKILHPSMNKQKLRIEFTKENGYLGVSNPKLLHSVSTLIFTNNIFNRDLPYYPPNETLEEFKQTIINIYSEAKSITRIKTGHHNYLEQILGYFPQILRNVKSLSYDWIHVDQFKALLSNHDCEMRELEDLQLNVLYPPHFRSRVNIFDFLREIGVKYGHQLKSFCFGTFYCDFNAPPHDKNFNNLDQPTTESLQLLIASGSLVVWPLLQKLKVDITSAKECLLAMIYAPNLKFLTIYEYDSTRDLVCLKLYFPQLQTLQIDERIARYDVFEKLILDLFGSKETFQAFETLTFKMDLNTTPCFDIAFRKFLNQYFTSVSLDVVEGGCGTNRVLFSLYLSHEDRLSFDTVKFRTNRRKLFTRHIYHTMRLNKAQEFTFKDDNDDDEDDKAARVVSRQAVVNHKLKRLNEYLARKNSLELDDDEKSMVSLLREEVPNGRKKRRQFFEKHLDMLIAKAQTWTKKKKNEETGIVFFDESSDDGF